MFNDEPANILIDSGSSVSILCKSFFDNVKHKIKYKRLGTNVQISTVNSCVVFDACAEISFQINRQYFKHPFYIVSLENQSNFQAILGYEFMTRFQVKLTPQENNITIKDKEIPLLNIIKDSDNSNMISQNINSNECTRARLNRKCVIQPGEQVYATFITDNLPNSKFFLFEPKFNNENIECDPAIFSQDRYSEDEYKCVNIKHEEYPFVIRNISTDQIVHINKNQDIGEICSNIQIEENHELNKNQEYLNLIEASAETLKKRKEELKSADFNLSHLSESQQKILLNLLMSNYPAFSKSLFTLGHTDKVIPRISLINKFPIRTLPFPIPQALQAEALQQLTELQEAGLIERAATEWACPMLLVKKKMSDNSQKQKYRLALDLRLLNAVIKHSAYPLPKISNIISNLSNYKYFTVCDLPSAYWQIDLPEKFQDTIAFTTPWGSFKSKRLVFGLKTAASTFQSLMDSILDEMQLDGVFAYQDDIVIASNSFDETNNKLKILFEALTKYNITLSPQKCQFHLKEINYLGFNISEQKIRPIQSNIIKITSFPTPKNKRQLKKFIGICGYYRHLIPAYANQIQPLIELTKYKTKFVWLAQHQTIFEQLQKIFFKFPFIRLPQWDKDFILNTDGSHFAISGVLMQEFNGELCPVSYFSKSLNNSESKYPAIKIELMALVKSIEAFKHYLFNRNFTVLSDSKPLEHYKKTTSPADITTRWLMELSEYSFRFKHIAGKQNILADYLSRLEMEPARQDINSNPEIINNNDEIFPIVQENDIQECTKNFSNYLLSSENDFQDPLLEISNKMFLIEQKKDKYLNKMYQGILHNRYNKSNQNYFIDPESRLLKYKPQDQYNNHPVIVVPNSLKAKVLAITHLTHFGIQKTYELLRQRFHWYGMYNDTVNFIKSCPKCITVKNHSFPHAPLQNSYIPKAPSEFISMDILGPFSNQQYILTVIDHFSRHIELYPLTRITTDAVTDCLFDYITSYGRPASILTDLGTQFTSEVFDSISKILGIKLMHTTTGHPQANALSERINTSIKSTVKCLLMEGKNFKHAIRIHKNLYNGSIHSSTGYSPNLIHFGRQLSLVFDTFQPEIEIQQLDKAHYIDTLLSTLKVIYSNTYQNLIRKQEKQNIDKNSNSRLRQIKVDDIVYIRSKDKFNNKYSGPYKVIKKHSDVTYSIQYLDNSHANIFKIHIDRLLLAPPRKDYLKTNDSFNQDNNVPMIPRYQLRNRNIL